MMQWLVLAGAIGFAGVAAAPTSAAEEPVAVRGRVVDAVSGSAVAAAQVVAGQTRVLTDASGAFDLALPPGDWTLTVTAPHYLEQARRVAVQSVPPPLLEIALVPKARFSESVDVQAATPRPVDPEVLPVSAAQVMTVAGSLDNIFHVIQTMPGVVATDEIGSRLSVRGGAPDENLTIMDGVEIHNPYRLFGLTSAFNPETVSRFEFSPGGFGVAHGDRLSSLLVVENRDGTDKRRFSGSSAVSVTDANVVLEGKLPVQKGSWLFTTRRTYYDLVAERFVDADLPAFRDMQFKAAWQPREGQKLSLTGVRSREDGDGTFDGDPGERGDFLLGVTNDLASAAFDARIGRGHSRSILAWYDNRSLFDAAAVFRSETRRTNTPDPDDRPFTAVAFSYAHVIRDLSARQEVSWPVGARHVLDTGFELHQLRAGFTYRIEGQRNPAATNGSSVLGGAGLPDLFESANSYVRGGGWIEDHFRISDRVTVVPGLRLDLSGITDNPTLSPRVSGTIGLGRSTRLRVAAGRYTQSPGYEKLIQSDYVVDQVDLGFENARHFSLGVERDLGRGVTARVELYHKQFDRLIVGRLETEAERQARVATYDYPPELQADIPTDPLVTSTPTGDGKGRAVGLDVYVTRAGPRLSGWLSYTVGDSRRQTYGQDYPFDYDRRHSATLVGGYRFSPRFQVSATARVASGFPWTPFAGVRVTGLEIDDRVVPERDLQGRLVYEVAAGPLSTLNSARLPFYARLDVRAAFRPRGDKGRWEFYVEAINALRRENVSAIEPELEYDPDSDRPKLVETPGGSVPFLPTFGVRFRFD